MTRSLRRARAPLAAATAMAAMTALAACSGDTDPGAADAADDSVADCQSAEPTGGFSYEDGRGETVELDAVPTTVVAQSSVAASLWDAGYQVDGAYGELNEVDGELDYQAGNIDLDAVEVIGKTYGEFDVDQYAQLQPDLLVDYTFDGENLWYVPQQQAKQVAKQAPSVGLNGNPEDIDAAIEMFVDLAGKLGVDTACNEELDEAKADYEASYDDLTTAAEETDLDVLIVSATETSFYVVNPEMLPETKSMTAAGVQVMEPQGGEPAVFHEFSWEAVGDYADADVILMDARVSEDILKKMEGIDTWSNHPAVKADQVYPAYLAAPYSYVEYAGLFGDLADQLRESEPLD